MFAMLTLPDLNAAIITFYIDDQITNFQTKFLNHASDDSCFRSLAHGCRTEYLFHDCSICAQGIYRYMINSVMVTKVTI